MSTVSYEPEFFPFDLRPKVSKIFIIRLLCCLTSSETFSVHEQRLQISEVGRKQTE